MLRLTLFGGLALTRDGMALPLPTRRTATALALLAVAGPGGLTRAALAAAIWPDRAEAQARASLRQALTAIRRCLEDGLALEADADRAALAGPPEAVDAWAFAAAPHPTLYAGALLADLPLDGPAEDLVRPERARLHRLAVELVDTGAPTPDHLALADRLLAADPAEEAAHRALIRGHLAQGHTTAARRQLADCAAALAAAYGAEPEAATAALLSAPPVQDDHRQPSLAVMPFDELGASDDFFTDGVVEEITDALAKVREFHVIARQSAYAYRGRYVDARAVGQELGVRYLVEGTVRRGADRVRISVQLVHAETGRLIWSERYDDSLDDLLAVQDRIASQVAGALSPSIQAEEIRTAHAFPKSGRGAYAHLLSAYPHFWSHRPDENEKAIAHLDQALALSPEKYQAVALRAWCHAQTGGYMWGDPAPARAAALSDVETALQLDIGDHAPSLVALSAALTLSHPDLDRARHLVDRALDLQPNSAWGWMRLGWIQTYQNDPEAALDSFARAERLSPRDPLMHNFRFGQAAAEGALGRYDRAEALVTEGMRHGPGARWAHRMLANYRLSRGDREGARAAVSDLRAAYPALTVGKLLACLPPALAVSNPRYRETFETGFEALGLPA